MSTSEIEGVAISGLHAVLGCGHESATVTVVQDGVRVAGQDWLVTGTHLDIQCRECDARARLTMTSA